MRLWIDDTRPAPNSWLWCKTVNVAKKVIEANSDSIDLISIDHDAGSYSWAGGDYIKLLDWLEETGRNYPIHIHSQNVVGRMNMERICRRNGWTIVK